MLHAGIQMPGNNKTRCGDGWNVVPEGVTVAALVSWLAMMQFKSLAFVERLADQGDGAVGIVPAHPWPHAEIHVLLKPV